ncbi:MAG: hypothetical protein JRI54_00025 [Deltaproteobacteria bacterium]|nr:hypothetical protein [Deltaproteobacteria bacterium]
MDAINEASEVFQDQIDETVERENLLKLAEFCAYELTDRNILEARAMARKILKIERGEINEKHSGR